MASVSDVNMSVTCMKCVKCAMFGMGNIVALQGVISVPFNKDTFVNLLIVKKVVKTVKCLLF